MFEEGTIGIFRKTLRQLIELIEQIKEIDISEFKDAIEDAFAGYNYDGIEDIVGFDSWGDISNSGKYELNIKIDHEDAYELTIFITNENGNIIVTNVL